MHFDVAGYHKLYHPEHNPVFYEDGQACLQLAESTLPMAKVELHHDD